MDWLAGIGLVWVVCDVIVAVAFVASALAERRAARRGAIVVPARDRGDATAGGVAAVRDPAVRRAAIAPPPIGWASGNAATLLAAGVTDEH